MSGVASSVVVGENENGGDGDGDGGLVDGLRGYWNS